MSFSHMTDVSGVSEVYQELQEISEKLKAEFKILHEREVALKEKEQTFAHAGTHLEEISELKKIIEHKDDQLSMMDNMLKEKLKENKRLQDSFSTLKSSNDSLKKELLSIQSQYEKLTKHSQSLQARLTNLQKKYDFEERKENLHADLPKLRQEAKKETKDKQPRLKVNTTHDLMSVLLEWISEYNLRQAISEQPTKEIACTADFIQEKCLKTLPQLVDILKEASTNNSKFVLPCLQYMYWSLLHLENGKGNQKSALSSTLRRLGEELYRPRLARCGDDTERPLEGYFFRSENLHVQFLSSLIILNTITQVDHLAHVFEVFRSTLKSDNAKELFLYYQATNAILQHLKPTNKTLLNSAIDTHLQMSMESAMLTEYLQSCSTETWFRSVSSLWRTPNMDHKVLEKLSIILQKLSKIKSNRKYFEVFGMINSSQEMMRNHGNNPESAFLNLNIKSILFNLSVAKGVA